MSNTPRRCWVRQRRSFRKCLAVYKTLGRPIASESENTMSLTLESGSRIVSHAFDLGSWKPQQRVVVSDRPIFLWTVGGR